MVQTRVSLNSDCKTTNSQTHLVGGKTASEIRLWSDIRRYYSNCYWFQLWPIKTLQSNRLMLSNAIQPSTSIAPFRNMQKQQMARNPKRIRNQSKSGISDDCKSGYCGNSIRSEGFLFSSEFLFLFCRSSLFVQLLGFNVSSRFSFRRMEPATVASSVASGAGVYWTGNGAKITAPSPRRDGERGGTE